MGGADGAGKFPLDVGPAEARIASGIQLHGFGNEHCSLAVHLDAAALIDQGRDDMPGSGPACHLAGDQGVLVPLRPVLAAPAVENPVHGTQPALAVQDKGGADVAHPRVVQRRRKHLDVRMQVGGGRFDVVGVHHDGDRLELDGGVRHCSPGGPGSVGGFS
jgi:chloramphenicol 3-O-phosphotransferase